MPEGRQTATFRLDEVLAAGSIPVFLSQPFVPPFAQLIDWQRLAVFVPPSRAGQLFDILAELQPGLISAMQSRVRAAWREFMSPDAARRSFYRVLREKAFAAREQERRGV